MGFNLDNIVYEDTGCKVHPACLSCPLPRCVYDLAPRKHGNWKRDQQMKEMRAAGATPTEIAKQFGVSRMRVYQVTA